jgi:glycosyltransferase involved in cell wall biosynthesis
VRILIYSEFFYPSIGGVEDTSSALASVLVELSHDVCVFTRTSLGDSPELCGVGYTIVRSTAKSCLFHFIRDSDLVISKGGVAAFACFFALIACKRFIVWHEMAGNIVSISQRSLGRALVNRIISRRSVLHVGVSSAVLHSLGITGNIRSEVVYNAASGFDLVNERFCPSLREFDLLFVGRLIEGKGVFVLAEALKILANEGCSYSLCIAGDGAERLNLEKMFLDVPGMVVSFCGSIDKVRLTRIFARSRVLVLPSTTHPEGMPVVIAEAFTFGLPVIGSNQPAIVETIGEAGVSFPSGCAVELSRMIRWILDNNEVEEELRRAAILRSERFSSARFRQRVSEVLDRVTR